MNNRKAIKFSSSQTSITLYESKIERRSLIWYSAADLRKFRDDRKADAYRINMKEYREENGDIICWWGLERLINQSVREKTTNAKTQVKISVLQKQGEACEDERCKSASEWAAKVAQKKATYYSSNI
jgi:hypothetical protein